MTEQRYNYRLAKYSGRTGKLLKVTPCQDWGELRVQYAEQRKNARYTDTYVRMEFRRVDTGEWTKMEHPIYG
jgi:hypothetical protein